MYIVHFLSRHKTVRGYVPIWLRMLVDLSTRRDSAQTDPSSVPSHFSHDTSPCHPGIAYGFRGGPYAKTYRGVTSTERGRIVRWVGETSRGENVKGAERPVTNR